MQTETTTEATTKATTETTAAKRPAMIRNRAIPPSWLEAPADAAVDALELSAWARRALWSAGASTVGDVRALRLERLATLSGVGPKTYCELDDLLDVLRGRFRPPGSGVRNAIDEIVYAVLDAADLEILEDVDDAAYHFASQAMGDNAVLLRRLIVDMVERYQERQQRESGGGPCRC